MTSPFRTMITFTDHNTRFTYRVSGITIHNQHALFERSNSGNSWHLPGGRAEFGETSVEALTREMHEELGVEIKIERLLFIVEDFFAFEERHNHTIGLIFLMTLPNDSDLYRQQSLFQREDNNEQLTFAWLPIANLEQLTIYPPFLHKALQALPTQPEHIISLGE